MRHLSSTLVLFSVIALVFFEPAPRASASKDIMKEDKMIFFIAPDGADSNNGSKERPFSSLERARDAVREHRVRNGGPEGGARILIRGGEYERSTTFFLTEEDSGVEGGPVEYRAYGDEEVFFTGGVTLDPSAFTPVTDAAILARIPEKARERVVQVDLRALGVGGFEKEMNPQGYCRPITYGPMELFVDGRAMTIARYPNDGRIGYRVIEQDTDLRQVHWEDIGPNWEPPVELKGGVIALETERVRAWGQANDAWVYGHFWNGFADDNIKVAKFDPSSGQATLAFPHLYRLGDGGGIRSIQVFNLLEELDTEEEYFIDRDSGILYFIPNGSLDGSAIQLSHLTEPLVLMEDVSFVEFRGITFETGRDMGINIVGGKGNMIENCVVRNMGTVGIMVGQGVTGPDYAVHEYAGGQNVSGYIGNIQSHLYFDSAWNNNPGKHHAITGCKIYGMGQGGVILGGGDRITLEKAENRVERTEITDYNRLVKMYRPGVYLTGTGNIVRNNHIHDAPGFAVYLYGNDHLIEYNEINNVVNRADDSGAFYMGRDPAARGNVIRYNYWHNIPGKDSYDGESSHGVMVVYLDDSASGTEVYGNVIKSSDRLGVMINGGRDNIVKNNIIIGSRHGVRVSDISVGNPFLESDSLFRRRLDAVGYQSSVFSKYENLANILEDHPDHPKYNRVEANVFIAVGNQFDFASIGGETTSVAGNIVFDELNEAGFVDPEGGDFRLKNDAEVFRRNPEFPKIPFSEIGIR